MQHLKLRDHPTNNDFLPSYDARRNTVVLLRQCSLLFDYFAAEHRAIGMYAFI